MGMELLSSDKSTIPAQTRDGRGSTMQKACAILRLLSDGNERRLCEIAEATGLNKVSSHRILQDLIKENFIKKLSDKSYVIGNDLVLFSRVQAKKMEAIFNVIRPSLSRIAAAVGDTAYFTSTSGHDLVYSDVVAASDLPTAHLRVGTRLPLGINPPGVAFLSAAAPNEARKILDIVENMLRPYPRLTRQKIERSVEAAREKGYAISLSCDYDKLAGIAVLIMSSWGDPLGCLSIASTASRIGQREEQLVAILRREAAIAVKGLSPLHYVRLRRGTQSPRVSH